MTTSIAWAAPLCTLLATAYCGLAAQPAAAQSGLMPTARPVSDANGVDVITGNTSHVCPFLLLYGAAADRPISSL